MSTPQGGKIRVLIVDDIVETRDNVKKLLYFENDVEIVGTGSNGREGVDLALKLQPDIVLMDINMPEMDGIAASEAISAQAPHIQVVMMSVQGEADYLRRSMLAGAREFLIKPFSGEELVNSIHRVHQFAANRRASAPPPVMIETAVAAPPPQKGAKVITIFGAKGGCGASTVAVNLAMALREETKARVALIDANFEFGDIGVLLNLPATRTIADLVGEKSDLDEEVLDGTLCGHSSTVRILLAPPRPELAELIKTEHLKKIIAFMDKSFDYIIVDLWKSFQETTVFFMDIANIIVIVSTTDIPAIKNAKLFFELTDQLAYPSSKTVLVLNKEDGRSGINPRDIEASIKHTIAATIPKDERTTSQAINRGLPFVLSQKNLAVSQAMIQLAKNVLKELDKDTVAGSPKLAAGKS